MFDSLTSRLGDVLDGLKRRGALKEQDVEAALREVEEEIGVGSEHIELVGRFEAYETGTGFHITPFARVLRPGYRLPPHPSEVARVSEPPFDFPVYPVHTRSDSTL